MHVHIVCAEGEAKFWLEPIVSLATYYRLNSKRLNEICFVENLKDRHSERAQRVEESVKNQISPLRSLRSLRSK